MAGRARDSRLRGWVFFQVVVWIIKGPAQEWHHIMAPGAPPRSLHISVPFHRHLARLPHAEQIGLVVEGAEMVRAMEPALVSVLMALQAIIIHHQCARRNEVARGCTHE